MERLTIDSNVVGGILKKCATCYGIDCRGCKTFINAISKLADYERTGLIPVEVSNMQEQWKEYKNIAIWKEASEEKPKNEISVLLKVKTKDGEIIREGFYEDGSIDELDFNGSKYAWVKPSGEKFRYVLKGWFFIYHNKDYILSCVENIDGEVEYWTYLPMNFYS